MAIPREAEDVVTKAIHAGWLVPLDDKWPREIARAALEAAEPYILGWKPSLQSIINERAEEIHAEHHSGYIVPSLDSCPEHTRAEYEALVADLQKGQP